MTVNASPQAAAPSTGAAAVMGQRRGRVHRKGSGTATTVRYVFLLLSVIFVLIPVYVLVVTSFKDGAEASPTTTWLLPEHWDTGNWVSAWSQLKGGLVRSLLLVVPSAIISAMLGSANGFVLSKWRFPGANVVFTLILFGMFIPYQAVMIPLMRLVTSVDLGFGIHTLILMHVVYGIPITTLIFRNYDESIPDELIEASRVDGAGMLRTYFSVVLPISAPQLRRRHHLAVHERVERLPLRAVLRRRGSVRPGHPRPEQPGARLDHGGLRGLDVRRPDRRRADAHRVHPAGQVLRRRAHGRLGQGLTRRTAPARGGPVLARGRGRRPLGSVSAVTDRVAPGDMVASWPGEARSAPTARPTSPST